MRHIYSLHVLGNLLSKNLRYLLILFCVALFFYCNWRRRELYSHASKLPGPFTLPFVGNILHFVTIYFSIGGSKDQKFDILPDIFHLDDYDKCLENDEAAVYCRITVQLVNSTNSSKVWKVIKEVSSSNKNYRYDLLRHGICVTERCNINETTSTCLNRIYEDKYKDVELKGQIIEQECETKVSKYTAGILDIATITILGLYSVLVLVVSFWLKKVGRNREKKNKNNNQVSMIKFLSIFSIFDNLSYLLNRNPKPKGKHYMLYVQGLRFFTSVIIIGLHTGYYQMATFLANPTDIEELFTEFFPMLLFNGVWTVEIFFVISSWFLAMNFFEKLKKDDEVGFGYVVRCIVRRYIKFAFVLFVLIISHSTWLVHLYNGPFWDPIMGQEYRACRENWWLNLLFINNPFRDSACLPQSWYMSADFQFTVLSLLMLWFIQKKPRRIFLVAGVVISSQIIFVFYILASNNFEFALIWKPEKCLYMKQILTEEFQATWTTSYSNVAGYMIGLCFAYLYVYQDKNIFTEKYKKLWKILCWILIIGSRLFNAFYMQSEYYSNSRWFAAAYGSLNLVIFPLGIGLLIFGMCQGLGGFLKEILEKPVMHTLGQLSFGAYLIHITFLDIDAASRRSLQYMGYVVAINAAIKNVIAAYLGSTMLTVFFIMPVEKLSKLII